jgi:hypothetical protein
MNMTSLTPTLSPRRGRNAPRALEKPNAGFATRSVKFFNAASKLFPLPGGEGQGEGGLEHFNRAN